MSINIVTPKGETVSTSQYEPARNFVINHDIATAGNPLRIVSKRGVKLDDLTAYSMPEGFQPSKIVGPADKHNPKWQTKSHDLKKKRAENLALTDKDFVRILGMQVQPYLDSLPKVPVAVAASRLAAGLEHEGSIGYYMKRSPDGYLQFMPMWSFSNNSPHTMLDMVHSTGLSWDHALPFIYRNMVWANDNACINYNLRFVSQENVLRMLVFVEPYLSNKRERAQCMIDLLTNPNPTQADRIRAHKFMAKANKRGLGLR